MKVIEKALISLSITFILTGILGIVINMTASASLIDGLVAYYPFAGNANDESINCNDGTVYGASLTTDRFGNANSAYNFGGVDDYIRIQDHDTLDMSDALTISMWVNPDDSLKSYHAIISKGDHPLHSNQAPWQLFVNNSNLCVYRLKNDNYSAEYNICTVPLNEWTYLAVTFDKNNGKVITYLNGNPVREWEKTNSIFIDDVDIVIGTQIYGGELHNDRYFHGLIDDIHIYKRALSETEVQSLYNPIPLPSTLALLFSGILGIIGIKEKLIKS